MADDPDLLGVVAAIPGVPPMNILFGAVKYLLRADDALAAWYPHLADAARAPDDDAFAAFRAFVLDRRDEVGAIALARRTQTNEVARCAAILPWVAEVVAAWGEPPHAVDIGASAGLNLCLPDYEYLYGDRVIGRSPVVIPCENRGGFPLPRDLPAFASRTGLDVDPVDVDDDDAVAWLEALVWPEHEDRLERLRAAIGIRREREVAMVAGDAVETLLAVERALPPGPLLAWHTITIYQFSAEQRAALSSAFADIATRRPIARIGLEGVPGTTGYAVRVGLDHDASPIVARAQAHGRWIDRPNGAG